jgi:hypothetical protein
VHHTIPFHTRMTPHNPVQALVKICINGHVAAYSSGPHRMLPKSTSIVAGMWQTVQKR